MYLHAGAVRRIRTDRGFSAASDCTRDYRAWASLAHSHLARSKCGLTQLESFITNGAPSNVCPSDDYYSKMRFTVPVSSIQKLRPIRGVSRRIGLTVSAIKETIRDEREMIAVGLYVDSLPGLHGGKLVQKRVPGHNYYRPHFHNYSYIKGVVVNGQQRNGFRLRIKGRAAAKGQVWVASDRKRLTGTFGKLRIRCNIWGRGNCRVLRKVH